MELRGKNALVTGATGGLGVAESEALARAGAAVLMVDIKGGAAAEAINAGLPARRRRSASSTAISSTPRLRSGSSASSTTRSAASTS